MPDHPELHRRRGYQHRHPGIVYLNGGRAQASWLAMEAMTARCGGIACPQQGHPRRALDPLAMAISMTNTVALGEGSIGQPRRL
jgi:hypothetical protein